MSNVRSKRLFNPSAKADPLEGITVIGGNVELFDAPDRKGGDIKTMRLVMKDGKIYKNTL